MGITLPVDTKLDDEKARRTAQEAADYFSQSGRRAGDEFSRYLNQGLGKVDTAKVRVQADALQRSFDKAADAAGKLRVEEEKLKAVEATGTATRTQLISQSERVEKARRAEARAVREAASAVRDYQTAQQALVAGGSAIGSIGNEAADAAKSVEKLGLSLGGVAGPLAISGAAEGLSIIGGAALELSGTLGLLPGAAAAAGAAFGTLTLAAHGFSDAIGDMGNQKKFAEDLQKLSPNAQQAALSIQAMLPALDGLKNSSQDALFNGVGQELNKFTSSYLPSVQQMTTSVSGSFNNMFKGVADQLMTPGTQTAMQSTMSNIERAFQNVTPAAASTSDAIAKIVDVSSGFLPGFADSMASAADKFSSFINTAQQTGELHQWIRDGVNAFDDLAGTIPTVTQAISEFSGGGKESIKEIVDAINGISGALKVASGDLAGFRDMWPSVADVAVGAINQINGPLNIVFGTDMQSATTTAQDKLNAELQRRRDARADAGVSAFSPSPGLTQMLLPAGGPTAPPDKDGYWWGHTPPTTPAFPSNPFAVPTVPASGAGGSKKQPLPTVPAGNQDPMSLLQGSPATASLYSAAGTVLDNQQKVAQAKSDLNTLEKANVRDEDAITKKHNELAQAEREEHESELRLNEAKQQAMGKSLKSLSDTHDAMQQLGVEIDKDFGISKGFGGIVENAVKALGNILAAPFLQALGFVAKANPNEGSGMVGIAAANGAFGSQYTPAAIAASQMSATGGMLPGYGTALMANYGANANAAIALAQSANGGQYARGASDLASRLADCSGAVSDLVEVMQNGAATPGRLFNTESFPGYAASHGWQPGLMPGALNVGVLHGGPGGGHMAATLPNGVNFESGGSHGGIAYGGPAAGADNPEFTEHWYLPTPGGVVAPYATPAITQAAAPGLYSPANTNPGLTSPIPAVGGGGGMYPQGLPPQIGASAAPAGLGTPYPAHPGNSGNIMGGLPLDALMAGASGLDMMMPGAGAAAKIGIQLANRTIGYAAQNAGILANGIGEFFSVGDNPKGSIGAGWLGKIAGGVAGAGMALPNMAGKKAQEQPQGGQGQGGTTIDQSDRSITVNNQRATEDQTGKIIAEHQAAMYDTPGRQ